MHLIQFKAVRPSTRRKIQLSANVAFDTVKCFPPIFTRVFLTNGDVHVPSGKKKSIKSIAAMERTMFVKSDGCAQLSAMVYH